VRGTLLDGDEQAEPGLRPGPDIAGPFRFIAGRRRERKRIVPRSGRTESGGPGDPVHRRREGFGPSTDPDPARAARLPWNPRELAPSVRAVAPRIRSCLLGVGLAASGLACAGPPTGKTPEAGVRL